MNVEMAPLLTTLAILNLQKNLPPTLLGASGNFLDVMGGQSTPVFYIHYEELFNLCRKGFE